MPLNVAEREQFLAEPHIGSLAVDAGPGRAPLVVPMWYQYTPGGDLWVMTGADSQKARLIRAAGRFSILAERVEPTIRYVSVEGPVTETIPATRALGDECAVPPGGESRGVRRDGPRGARRAGRHSTAARALDLRGPGLALIPT